MKNEFLEILKDAYPQGFSPLYTSGASLQLWREEIAFALEDAAKRAAQAEEEDALEVVLESYRDMFGVKTERANEIHRLACAEVARLRAGIVR